MRLKFRFLKFINRIDPDHIVRREKKAKGKCWLNMIYSMFGIGNVNSQTLD